MLRRGGFRKRKVALKDKNDINTIAQELRQGGAKKVGEQIPGNLASLVGKSVVFNNDYTDYNSQLATTDCAEEKTHENENAFLSNERNNAGMSGGVVHKEAAHIPLLRFWNGR